MQRLQETLLAEAYVAAPAPQASLTVSRPPTYEFRFPHYSFDLLRRRFGLRNEYTPDQGEHSSVESGVTIH